MRYKPRIMFLGTFHYPIHEPIDIEKTPRRKLIARGRSLQILDTIRKIDPETSRAVVISSVRDPIARIYSQFFEHDLNVPVASGASPHAGTGRPENIDSLKPVFHEVLDYLVESELSYLKDHLEGGIKREFPNLLLREIVTKPSKCGTFAKYGSGGVLGRILKAPILFNSLSAVLDDLGIDGSHMKMTTKNSAKEIGYHEFYDEFMTRVPFPKESFHKVYDSVFLRMVYSPAEIDSFKTGWLNRWR